MIELPPIIDAPIMSAKGSHNYRADYFSRAQMREYGEACARAALESAAAICSRGVDIPHPEGYVMKERSDVLATAIRALISPSSQSSERVSAS